MDADEGRKIGSRVIDSLIRNQSVVVSTSGKDHEAVAMEIYRAASLGCKRVCVVTLDRPFSHLLLRLHEAGIGTSNFCAIDCTSAKKKDLSGLKNDCVYITSPAALSDLSLAIEKVIPKNKVDLVIVDNASTFMVYNQDVVALRFMHTMIVRLRDLKVKNIHFVLKQDERILGDLSLFADAVIEI